MQLQPLLGWIKGKNNEVVKRDGGSGQNYTKCMHELILLHEKFLQFDWLRAVVFQLNLKYLHVKITNLLRVVV